MVTLPSDLEGVESLIRYQKAALEHLDKVIVLRMKFLSQVSEGMPPEGLQERIRAYMQQRIASGEMVVWLACAGQEMVGIALIDYGHTIPNYVRPTGRVGYISNVYTLPEYRRKGIAKVLVQKLMDDAREMRCDRVALSSTEMGRSLYVQLGFKPVKDELSWYPMGYQ